MTPKALSGFIGFYGFVSLTLYIYFVVVKKCSRPRYQFTSYSLISATDSLLPPFGYHFHITGYRDIHQYEACVVDASWSLLFKVKVYLKVSKRKHERMSGSTLNTYFEMSKGYDASFVRQTTIGSRLSFEDCSLRGLNKSYAIVRAINLWCLSK